MGKGLSKFMDEHFGKREMKVLLLGLEGSGKSTILYRLKLGKAVEVGPTKGFNVETINYKKQIRFTIWDITLGKNKNDGKKLVPHFRNAEAVIFVVDAAKDSFKAEKQYLRFLMEEPTLSDKAFLIFANKQDLPSAKAATELARSHLSVEMLTKARRRASSLGAESLPLKALRGLLAAGNEDYDQDDPQGESVDASADFTHSTHERVSRKLRLKWNMQGSCALSGDGLYEGLDWLSKYNEQVRKQERRKSAVAT